MKLFRLCDISYPRSAWPALLIPFILTDCTMNDLPRNMGLKAFNPHRTDFACVHEASKLAPITNEVEVLFQQGMAVTSNELWPNQRDYRTAAQLWEQAAAKGHWKASMNLAGFYERGLGVQRDAERAVQMVEGLMKQDVPGAFDKMGTYHQSGIGVKRDIDRAYGFWQLAADMGSPGAQTYLGYKLDAAYDDAQMGVWGNSKVGIKMLECAFAQGHGEAAYKLGQTLNLVDKNYARALAVLHEGVKFGSSDAASYLFASFDDVDPLTFNLIDRARAERYSTIAAALELNPDLRLPNLDKVLPLPPAALPFWDGKRETLIDAAKAVIVKHPTPATPGANRTGRAHVPQGHVLPSNITLPPGENAFDNHGRPWSLTTKQHAHFTGYWQPRIDVVRGDWQRDWNAAQAPQHFERGESLPSLAEQIPPGYGAVSWDYKGLPVQQVSPVHPYVAQGVARYVPAPEMPRSCSGTVRCPQTGIWSARLKQEHAHHAVFHAQWQQTYMEKGQPFPDPTTLREAGGITVAARDIRWHWVGDANQADASGHVHITSTPIAL
ncbi:MULTISPECIES: DUF6396 domain-containing protein [unclassified Variovorax]|uniref:SEL1-like repeat protein n=1 Tax=unclassified Variovorax TaxID=663243 RepID=UPI003F472743